MKFRILVTGVAVAALALIGAGAALAQDHNDSRGYSFCSDRHSGSMHSQGDHGCG
jgi:hypothetical protein